MEYEAVIEKLKSLSDPRALAAWDRMNVSHEAYLGVNLTKLKGVAKEIKRDHELALELWASEIHDAKLLATMIEEPKKVPLAQVDQQITEIYSVDLADKYASNVVAKTPFVQAKMKEWTVAHNEMIKRSGYMLLVSQARRDKKLPDDYFEQFLNTIEANIQTEQNWVKEAMIYAMIAIGSRNKQLNAQAVQVANNVGEVVVDYGDTACVTPNVLGKLADERLLTKLEAGLND